MSRMTLRPPGLVSSDSSLELDEESEEPFINSAKTPGLDSSSMMANGSSDSSSSSSDESDDTTASWTTAKRIKRAMKYFLIDDGLGDTGVEIRVCSQLEDDVENIYQQKNNTENTLVSLRQYPPGHHR
jgi:hypothetical protein